MAPLPHIGEPVAAADLLRPLLEGVVGSGRVSLVGSGGSHHAAQVNEVLLCCRPLGRRAPHPLYGEVSWRHRHVVPSLDRGAVLAGERIAVLDLVAVSDQHPRRLDPTVRHKMVAGRTCARPFTRQRGLALRYSSSGRSPQQTGLPANLHSA
jgi:hypothetical protein